MKMKEFITIKNLGPLRDIQELELRPLTVLIGESAIGKSTLMKIVSLMRYLYKMANIRSYLKLSKITSSPFRMRFDSMMNDSGLSYMLQNDTEIIYKVVCEHSKNEENTNKLINEEKVYELVFRNKKLAKLPSIEKEALMLSKISFISENRNIIPTWIEKASMNAGATLGFYFHETYKDFAKAAENDQVVNLDYVGMKLHISHPKGKNVQLKVESIGEHGHDKIDLKNSSSGIQTSAPLALIVNHFSHEFSFKDAFNRSVLNYLHEIDRLTKFKAVTEPADLNKVIYVHVEEPELSLFPNAQCKLIDEIVRTANNAEEDRKVNLMLATHSPYILNYLNIILNQTKEDRAHVGPSNMAVYRLFDGKALPLLAKDENGKDMVDTYDLTEMMNSIYEEYNTLV